MPRFKSVHRGLKPLQMNFDQQMTPGKFEHALCHLVDDAGGRMITRRFATVEPMFGNLCHNKRLDRFTLCERDRVDGQCLSAAP